MRTLAVFPLVALASLLCTTHVGHAVGADPAGSVCNEDIQKFCGDVTPGEGRILMCLQSHIDRISPECRGAMETGKKKVKEAADACREDAEKFCAGIQPGGGRIAICLKQNFESLSPACRQVMEQAASERRRGQQ
jgi:hypothetical protein